MTGNVDRLIERLEAAFVRIEKAYHDHTLIHAKEKLELVSDLESAYAQNRDLEEKIEVTKDRLDAVISRLNTLLEEDEREQVDAA